MHPRCNGCIVRSVEGIAERSQYISAVGGATATPSSGSHMTSVTTRVGERVLGHVLDFVDTIQIFVGHASVVSFRRFSPRGEERASPAGHDHRFLVARNYSGGSARHWWAADHYAKGGIRQARLVLSAPQLRRASCSVSRRPAHPCLRHAASEAADSIEQFGTHCKRSMPGARTKSLSRRLLAKPASPGENRSGRQCDI